MALYRSNSGKKPQNGELHLFISWVFRGKRRKAKTVKINVKMVFFALKRVKTRLKTGFSGNCIFLDRMPCGMRTI